MSLVQAALTLMWTILQPPNSVLHLLGYSQTSPKKHSVKKQVESIHIFAHIHPAAPRLTQRKDLTMTLKTITFDSFAIFLSKNLWELSDFFAFQGFLFVCFFILTKQNLMDPNFHFNVFCCL